jgi:hypothetical protein
MSGAEAPPPAPLPWLFELKRQATDRGEEAESTKWNLKFEYRPAAGAAAFYRFELPLDDVDNDLEGSPFNVRRGDVKGRIGFRTVPVLDHATTSFVEITFPTATPEDRGSGKYQASIGARMQFPLGVAGETRYSMGIQLQQVVSFAGDENRKDVNQTKSEIDWRFDWPRGHFAKATFKPVYDWVGRRDGAVLEAETGWAASRQWTLVMLLGGRLWGEGTPGTYGTRIEAKVIYRF